MAKIALNKKTIFSFLLFSTLFFFLPVNNPFASATTVASSLNGGGKSGYDLGYDSSQLSKQAKNLSNTFNKDYGLSSQTKPAQRTQSKRAVSSSNKQENATDKTSFFSPDPVYKKIFSSIANIPSQTASVFSSILSPVGDFVSGLFITDSYKVESSSSSPSVIPAKAGIQAVSNKFDNPQLTNSTSKSKNLDPRIREDDRSVASSVTRKEVQTLIKQSDDRNLALIRSIITAPNPLTNSDSLSVNQSIVNINNKISRLEQREYVSPRQIEHVYTAIGRSVDNKSSFDDIDITNSTITSSSFSGTTGTFTGVFSGVSGTFSSSLTVGSQLTVSGTATSTLAGDTNFDSGTLYIDSLNNRVGIASSSPSETLSINGPTYLSQISAPSNTTDRLYNTSGDLYWNGTVIGSASVGNWTSSGGNVYRSSGSVGIGTTSPGTILSVSSVGNFAGTGSTLYSTLTAPYFTATSTTASTFPYASTTALTVSGNSYLGTISSGTWNGSLLSVPYGGTGRASIQSGTIPYGNGSSALSTTTAGTAGYVLAYLNGVPTWTATTTLSNITGTLAVSSGGTGQSTFGQGWLHSDGTTFTSSTSPTVAYLTATSTTATSTFAGGLSVAGSSGLTVLQNGNVGVGTSSPQVRLDVFDGSLRFRNTLNPNTYIESYSIHSDGRMGLRLDNGQAIIRAGSGASVVSIGPGSQITAGAVGGSIGFRSVGIPIIGSAVFGPDDFEGGTHKSLAIGTPDVQPRSGYGTTGIVDVATFSMVNNSPNGQRPSIRLTGDELIFRTDTGNGTGNPGTEIMRITGGNVGIGTTSPYAKLSVVGETVAEKFTATSTTATSTFAGGMNVAGTAGLTVLQNGNVGVGTAAPDARLVFQAATQDGSSAVLVKNSAADVGLRIYDNGGMFTTAGTPFQISNGRLWQITANSTTFNLVDASAGPTRLTVDSLGNLGIGTTSPNWKTQIAGTRPFLALSDTSAGTNDKHWLMSSQGGNFYIGTSTDTLNATSTYFTIDKAGHVGIGDSTNSDKLFISGNSSNKIGMAIYNSSSVASTTEIFLGGNSAATGWALTSDIDRSGTDSFSIWGGGAGDTRLHINSSGYVGIGNNSNPTAPLHVSTSAPDVSSGASFYVSGTLNSTSNYLSGIRSGPNVAPSLASTYDFAGAALWPYSNSSNLSGGGMTGVSAGTYYSGTGVLSWAKGGFFRNDIVAAGTISSAYGVYVADNVKSAGTITNQYGLYMENQTTGNTNYSIYSAGGKSYFGGNVGAGTTSPYSKLTVWGGGTGTNTAFEVANSASTTLMSVLDNGTVTLGTATAGDIIFDTSATGNVVRVGMGTTTPDADFVLVSNQTASNTYLFTIATTTGNVVNRRFIVDSDGDVHYDGSLVNSADYAESFSVVGNKSDYEAGDIIVLATSTPGKVKKSEHPYESRLVGIYSTKPGIIGSLAPDITDYEIGKTNDIPVGMLGRVPVKVSLEGGAIGVGDKITSSSLPGIGMKANSSGPVIGIALEPYNGEVDGKILVLLSQKEDKLDLPESDLRDEVNKLKLEIETMKLGGSYGGSDTEGAGVLSAGFGWVLDQFKNVGMVIESGILSVKELVSEKITTKKICIEDVCVDKNQLKELLLKNGISDVSAGTSASSSSSSSSSGVMSSSSSENSSELSASSSSSAVQASSSSSNSSLSASSVSVSSDSSSSASSANLEVELPSSSSSDSSMTNSSSAESASSASSEIN